MLRIVTDSTSDITLEEAKEYDIEIVPLYVIFGEKSYKDRIELSTSDFYEMLEKEQSTTSQPSPSDFLTIFDKYPDDDILCITCTKKLSGTYQSANIARENSDNENIYVIDSNTITLGLRNMVLQAVKMRAENLELKVIMGKLEEMKDRNFIIGAVETLECLKRGGRISGVSAAVGSLLNIRPILNVEDGVINVLPKKVRGNQNAIKEVTKIVSDLEIDTDLMVSVGYSKESKNADLLIKKIKESGISVEDKNICEIGPVIGSHVGAGCFLLEFFKKEKSS